jgi:Xaa-Pro aminopeptidase
MVKEEYQIKERRLRDLLERRNLAGIILSTLTNFLWLTGGKRNQIIQNADISLVHLLITKNKRYLFATRSDADRIMDEELSDLGFELVLYDWYNQSFVDALQTIGINGTIGCDFSYEEFPNIEEDIAKLRVSLTEYEVKRVKTLCRDYTEFLTDFCFSLKPGGTEKDIVCDLHCKCVKRNIFPLVLMVGSDERVFAYRHPVATNKKVKEYVLIATVVERDGLNVSMSRSVYFGTLPAELKKKQTAVNTIESAYYFHSLPGTSLGDLFDIGKEAYAKLGYPNEWENHTQGGIVGYKPRELLVTEDCEIEIHRNNVLGWNPTIRGVKAEDFILVGEKEVEQLSIDPRWPYEEIQVHTKTFQKPKILEIL